MMAAPCHSQIKSWAVERSEVESDQGMGRLKVAEGWSQGGGWAELGCASRESRSLMGGVDLAYGHCQRGGWAELR